MPTLRPSSSPSCFSATWRAIGGTATNPSSAMSATADTPPIATRRSHRRRHSVRQNPARACHDGDDSNSVAKARGIGVKIRLPLVAMTGRPSGSLPTSITDLLDLLARRQSSFSEPMTIHISSVRRSVFRAFGKAAAGSQRDRQGDLQDRDVPRRRRAGSDRRSRRRRGSDAGHAVRHSRRLAHGTGAHQGRVAAAARRAGAPGASGGAAAGRIGALRRRSRRRACRPRRPTRPRWRAWPRRSTSCWARSSGTRGCRRRSRRRSTASTSMCCAPSPSRRSRVPRATRSPTRWTS